MMPFVPNFFNSNLNVNNSESSFSYAPYSFIFILIIIFVCCLFSMYKNFDTSQLFEGTGSGFNMLILVCIILFLGCSASSIIYSSELKEEDGKIYRSLINYINNRKFYNNY
jgi:amino acid transporter